MPLYCARPLDSPAASLALGYNESSAHAGNIEHVKNQRRGRYVLVTPGNSDAPGATGAASAQQELNWGGEVASKTGILSVAIPVLVNHRRNMVMNMCEKLRITQL